MKRSAKWVVIGLGAIAVLFVLLLVVERVRGEVALRSRIKELNQKGESLQLADFRPPRVPDPENVFSGLLVVTNELDALKISDLAPRSLHLISTGRAVVTADLDYWCLSDHQTNSWLALEEKLASATGVTSIIRSAVQRPRFDSGFDYDQGFLVFKMPPIAAVRSAAVLLQAEVLLDLRKARFTSAHQSLVSLVQLSAKQTPEPLLISQLVRHACAAAAFNATWQALQTNCWSDEQLATLASAWSGCDFVRDMTRAMETERALTMDFYRQMRGSRKVFRAVLEERRKSREAVGEDIGGLLLGQAKWCEPVTSQVWRLCWAPHDELAALNDFQSGIEQIRIGRTNGWDAVNKLEPGALDHLGTLFDRENPGWYNRHRYWFAAEGFALNKSMIRNALQQQTQQQLALAAIGLARYRLKNGEVPGALDQLVPAFCASLPRDDMRAAPLGYQKTGPNDYRLYSVGLDGEDNGGDASLQPDKKTYGRIWDGRDAVWPAAATPAESMAAQHASGK